MLTKRRDACWYIRILIPISHVQSYGHEFQEHQFELAYSCPACKKGGVQEFQVLAEYPDGKVHCRECGHVLNDNVSDWKDSLLASIEWADAVGFQRAVNPEHIELMKLAKSKGKWIFTIDDDDYFNVPTWNTGYDYYVKRREYIEQTFKLADAVNVTTPTLKHLYGQLNPNVQLIPNANDIEMIEATPPAPNAPMFRIQREKGSREAKVVPTHIQEYLNARQGKKVYWWGGSPTHEEDLKHVIAPLRSLMNREPDAIVCFMGYVHRAAIAVLPPERLFLFGIVPVMHYFSVLKLIGHDFLFAPVDFNDFNASKSANKALEADALGVIPICSDFHTYRHAFKRGFYSDNTEYGWNRAFKYAHQLSAEERETYKSENLEWVKKYYDIKATAPLWAKFFETGKAEHNIYDDLLREGEAK